MLTNLSALYSYFPLIPHSFFLFPFLASYFLVSELCIPSLSHSFYLPCCRRNENPRCVSYVRFSFVCVFSFIPPLYLQHHGHSRTIVGAIRDKRTGV